LETQPLQGGEYRGKIVLTDDNPSNTKQLAELISQQHWDVFTAYNGHDLMELVQHIKPDILMMNAHVSEFADQEVVRRMRSNPDPQIRDILVVVVSSLILPGDRDKWIQLGADEYLRKPLRVTDLLDRCLSLMSSQV
jgi:CheY-like chemotaxis protein